MRCSTVWPTRPAQRRRGLTLVELMVTIALMLLIMSIIVAIFTAATGAMTTAQTDQELATVTRRLDTVLRQDLSGATAHFTPPLDPNDGLGYFEYGENAFADLQGEDTDDYLAFTAKAPPGQPFTGRIMLPRGTYTRGPRVGQTRLAPTTITSDFAEIIYFLRHGNLYRRVLLIVPERRDSLVADIDPSTSNFRYLPSDGFDLDGDNQVDVSWQGANDVSVHPSQTRLVPEPNTLGDLTNRHNRAFRPGFVNDYFNNQTQALAPDGQFDDFNDNGVPDFYPTLYPSVFNAGLVNENLSYRGQAPLAGTNTYDVLAFPFLFPTAYSTGGSFPSPIPQSGTIHVVPTGNHSPLDQGDNLPVPSSPNERWTWWGFPTWAETRSINWLAPTKPLNQNRFGFAPGIQPYGLSWQRALSGSPDWLPPQTTHWYSDGQGNSTLATGPLTQQDDLIATNVRSFDVKAYDPHQFLYGSSLSNRYVDLGYAAAFPINKSQSVTGVDEVITFGHEGRIPPLMNDNRRDYRMETLMEYKGDPDAFATVFGTGYNINIGDNGSNVVRMRRVWDSWSTDYAFAPYRGTNPFQGPPTSRPVYPSYPPPYPSPLRGIQIQIRIASPENDRLKTLTIRQDFTDKL